MGVDPKIKIYDKTKEIRARQKKKADLTKWEEEILIDKKQITRIEVAVKRPGLNLEELVNDPASLVSYLERLEFFNLEDDRNISAVGGLQMIMRNTRREFRNALKEFTDGRLKKLIREDYLEGVKNWFSDNSKIINDNIPF